MEQKYNMDIVNDITVEQYVLNKKSQINDVYLSSFFELLNLAQCTGKLLNLSIIIENYEQIKFGYAKNDSEKEYLIVNNLENIGNLLKYLPKESEQDVSIEFLKSIDCLSRFNNNATVQEHIKMSCRIFVTSREENKKKNLYTIETRSVVLRKNNFEEDFTNFAGEKYFALYQKYLLDNNISVNTEPKIRQFKL